MSTFEVLTYLRPSRPIKPQDVDTIAARVAAIGEVPLVTGILNICPTSI